MLCNSSVVYLKTSFDARHFQAASPLAPRVTVVCLSISVFALVLVPHVAFRLRAHLTLVSLAESMGFGMLVQWPWRELG
jgi:hypothetical protein